METRITKEKVDNEVIWTLWEVSRPGVNEPWVAIYDNPDRKKVKQYQNFLNRTARPEI